MNRFFAFITCILLTGYGRAAGPADTVIQNVKVVFGYSNDIFPPSWKVDPISANGEALYAHEVGRSKAISSVALAKYPTSLLDLNLKTIYFVRSMKFYEVRFGATNFTDALYISNDGEAMGYTDIFIEQSIHHEFSSILYRNYSRFMDTTAWKKINVAGFLYNDPEAGVGAIRKNESSLLFDTVLARKGFLTQYALSDIENDINVLAQNLFAPSEGFWNIVDQFPLIRQKVTLLIRFYNKLLATFTEAYFRAFDK